MLTKYYDSSTTHIQFFNLQVKIVISMLKRKNKY